MRLQQLLRDADLPCPESIENRQVGTVCCDSRAEAAGSVFAALRGRNTDGNRYIPQMLSRGALCAISDAPPFADERIIAVEDARAAYARLCRAFYGRGEEQLSLYAVTGTNGKTTVCHMLRHILRQAGVPCGLLGTAGNHSLHHDFAADKTTPDAGDLHRMLAQMAQEGCSACVMEASSQALDQQRLAGCRFAAVGFTNLSQDHLDYHGDMESYFQAKKKAFRLLTEEGKAILFCDDPYGEMLSHSVKHPVIHCSAKDPSAEIYADRLHSSGLSMCFELHLAKSVQKISLASVGRFSVYNALVSAGMAAAAGVAEADIAKALCGFAGVRGRCEVLYRGDFSVICDYAHTPDGLKNILCALRPAVKGRLILLFGCGGERDRGKRPLMGRIAAEYADYTVLTSDNPRSENPIEILRQIRAGLFSGGGAHLMIPDRREAMEWAFSNAQKGDIILLAGKGHETSQIFADHAEPFDEREITAHLLGREVNLQGE